MPRERLEPVLGRPAAWGLLITAGLAPGIILVSGWPASDGFGFGMLLLAAGDHVVVADDLSSAELNSRQLVDKLLPEIEWRGGGEYDSDPYKGLADNSLAKRVLGWQPQYRWRS